jgi:hypothetical protein
MASVKTNCRSKSSLPTPSRGNRADDELGDRLQMARGGRGQHQQPDVRTRGDPSNAVRYRGPVCVLPSVRLQLQIHAYESEAVKGPSRIRHGIVTAEPLGSLPRPTPASGYKSNQAVVVLFELFIARFLLISWGHHMYVRRLSGQNSTRKQ